jgi:hypothetical protein
VHTGFGAQQAKGVFTFDLDGGAFDASRVASGFVFKRGFEVFAFGVLQVLTQQHAGPIARLSAAGTGLNVQKAVQRVGRVVEHAAEFQPLHHFTEFGCFTFDGQQAGKVAVILGHLEQFRVVGQLAAEVVEHQHHIFQRLFLFAQVLGALGVVPDLGVFQRAGDFAQLECFGIVVKDTSVTRRPWRSGRRGGWRWC